MGRHSRSPILPLRTRPAHSTAPAIMTPVSAREALPAWQPPAGGWPGNQSCLNILAWCWLKNDERSLVIVNCSAETSQALIRVPWDDLRDRNWRLDDRFSGKSFERSGFDMCDAGLYVEPGPWGCNLFQLSAG